MAHIYFFGATRQVTGSQHLLELSDGTRILVDCGIDMQSNGSDATTFAMVPSSVDILLLTHAHIDHSGLIPLLVAEGFTGPIYTTHATYQLCKILLRDSARLNMKKFQHRRVKPSDYYDSKMVEEIWDQFITVDFESPKSIREDVTATFHETGHLLGAASILIRWLDDNEQKSILFSGDIGRRNDPLLKDPAIPPKADYLICESTYGGRTHLQNADRREEVVLRIIQETCIQNPGRLIVPAFSVGRTQAFLYTLRVLRHKGLLPPIPVFTDSPLAHKSTRIYEDFQSFLNPAALKFAEKAGSLFDFDELTYLPNMNSAEQIQNYNAPCIILTSSGMVRGGKSEDHVMMNLQNPFCTILFIGFCAEGTLGHQLLSGKATLRIDREHIPVNARIEQTDAFSGHADHYALLEFIHQVAGDAFKKVFFVHGESHAMEALASELNDVNVSVPFARQTFFL